MSRIALIQRNIEWLNIDSNLAHIETMLDGVSADVVVLSEMFQMGFATNPCEVADAGKTLQWMLRMAKKLDAAVVGSCAVEEGGEYRNRLYFVKPTGEVEFYDKWHLFSIGGESKSYSRGNERKVVEWRGVRYLLAICYDLRFPVWARNQSGSDYDIILVVANWPDIRIQYWDALIAARTTENQCYIAAVNCVGNDGMGLHYNGHSVAYDTRLQPIVSFADDEEGTKIADFDIEKLHHFREVLPLWKDVDEFSIL